MATQIKFANPLSHPLAVLAGGIVLVIGVRFVNLSSVVMLPAAVGIATAGAMVQKSQERVHYSRGNSELESQLQLVRAQAQKLAEKAKELRLEASELLTDSSQIDLLAAVQYASDRACELPAKIDQLSQRLQGDNSLLSVRELEQQLVAVQEKLGSSTGVTLEQLKQLKTRLLSNIQLARQGQDARTAQIIALSTLVQDSAGVLQQLQNQLRTADLTQKAATQKLQILSEELSSFQENVNLLVSQ